MLARWARVFAPLLLAGVVHCGSDTDSGRGGASSASNGGAGSANGGSGNSSGGTAGSGGAAAGSGGIVAGGAGSSGSSGASATGGSAGTGGTDGGDAGNGGDGGDGGEGGESEPPCVWIDVDAPREISEPGCYRLIADLSQADTVLSIHDATNVRLDCQNHAITTTATASGAVAIRNMQRLTIENCQVTASYDQMAIFGLMINDSSILTLTNNILRSINVQTATDLTVKGNTIRSFLQAYDSTGVLIENNSFEGSSTVLIAAPIVLARGSDNIVRGNTVDGLWNGDPASTLGADDGIVIQDETNDRVETNIFLNNWDCGIETVGYVVDSVFIDNTVIKSNYCCIGAWYGSSWRNNTVSDNTCSDVGSLFQFRRIFDLQDGETFVYFQNNVFENNTQLTGGYENTSFFDFFNLPEGLVQSEVVFEGNRFTGNTFRSLTPVMIPPSMFVDGGGNVCQSGADATHPLACGRP